MIYCSSLLDKFELTFTCGMSVSDINKHDIPHKPLKFTPFADILTEKWKRDVLTALQKYISFY